MSRSDGDPVPTDPSVDDHRLVGRVLVRMRSLVGTGHRSREEIVALGLSGLLLLVAAGYLWTAVNLNWGTLRRPGVGFFPTIVGGALLVAATIDLVASIRRAPDDDSAEQGVQSESTGGFGDAAWRVPVLFGLLVVYGVGVGIAGHLLTAAVVCTLVVRILGASAWWKSAVAGFAVAWASVLVFDTLLGMRLPG